MGPVDLTAVGSAGRLQEKFVAVVVGALSEIRIWVDFFTSMDFPVWGLENVPSATCGELPPLICQVH